MVKLFASIVQRYKILKTIPLFKSIRWYPLQRIARRVQLVEFKKGEIIRKEGDPPDALYCLVSGRVQAYTTAADGKRKTDVQFFRRGMPFGIISFFTNQPHSSTYEVINDATIIKIEKNDLEYILEFLPQLGVELGHALSSQMRSRMTPSKRNIEHRIISVYSPTRGSGSSTYATNLALELEEQTHRKVILVSIASAESRPPEPGKDLASPHWQKPPVHLSEIIDDDTRLHSSIIRGQLKIDLLNVVFDTSNQVLLDSISQFVTTLVGDYHFTVVDLPTEKDALVMKTLTQSDVVHLLARDNPEEIKGLNIVINEVAERMKENFNSDFLKVLILTNQKPGPINLTEISHEIDFPVYARIPHIEAGELSTTLSCEAMTVSLPLPKSAYSLEVRRIARQLSGVSVGLALGGGAALGIAHIGVLRVLEQEEIPIDMISGSSMGAMIAALWTTGKSAKDLEELARDFEKPSNIYKLLCDLIFPVAGFIGGNKVIHWMNNRGLAGKTFYDTRMPVKIIAYDLLRREELVIESGSLIDAVRQSISIPGVIKPVLMKDRWIIDGGVLNPLPTNVLVQSGAKKIIAVNVLQSPEQVVVGYLDEQRQLAEEDKIGFWEAPNKFIFFKVKRILLNMISPNISDIILRTLQASEFVIAQQSSRAADVVIHPDLSKINWYELYEVDKLIKRGEDAARAALPQIRQMLSE